MSTSRSKGAGSQSMMSQLLAIARISALTEMASGIAHELNQPLGAIATFAQAGERMLDRPSPMVGQTIEALRQINHQALSAGEAIRRVRRLFDQDGFMRTRCHMSELIQELKPILEMLAQQRLGRLRLDVVESQPAVNVDRLRIQHVLFALAQNACDASAHGELPPQITVSVRSDRYEVQTSIDDSGPGVPEAIRGQLFRPFFTTKAGGTGLGLASSRAIVEAHEGRIGFENLPTGGSRFWFRLPIAG